MSLNYPDKKRGRKTMCPDDELLMRLYEEHTSSEIAEMYDVAPATVRSWLVRAKKRIEDGNNINQQN